MSTPLQRLTAQPGVPITAQSLEGFLRVPGPAVLLFTGDPAQRPEAQDIAVVAKELARQVPGLGIGVVASSAESELKTQFKVDAVPTVIFLEDGKVKATVARLQNWAAYASTATLVFGKRQESVPS